MIKCFEDGLLGLKQGAKVDLVCPPDYTRDMPLKEAVPDNAVIYISVEIVNVKKYVEFSVTETQAGEGKPIQKGSNVDLHLTLTLETGEVVGSTRDKGGALGMIMGENNAMKCLEMGLLGLKEGSKADLVCPPALAYGDFPSEESNIPIFCTVYISVEIVYHKLVSLEVLLSELGSGPTAEDGDFVAFHFNATVDGSLVSSSHEQGQPSVA